MSRFALFVLFLLTAPNVIGVSASQGDWIGVYRLTASEAARDLPLIEHRLTAGESIEPEALLPPDVMPGEALELRIQGQGRPVVKVFVTPE